MAGMLCWLFMRSFSLFVLIPSNRLFWFSKLLTNSSRNAFGDINIRPQISGSVSAMIWCTLDLKMRLRRKEPHKLPAQNQHNFFCFGDNLASAHHDAFCLEGWANP